MALNSGTRCGVCSRFFCCPRHRLDHQVKAHADIYSKEGQNLLQYFQLKAESVLLRSQKHRAKHNERNTGAKCDKVPSTNTNNNDEFVPRKRRHDGSHKQILTTSLTTSSQRKILIPSYRLRHSRMLNFYKDSSSQVSKSLVTDENKSPSEVTHLVKTSTPIVKALSAQSTWDDISPASALSDVCAPVDACKLQTRTKGPVTPLRSIMAKISKYQSPSMSDSGSRGRRVTFSLSSELSMSASNSVTISGLQKINEVDDKPDSTNEEEHFPHNSLQCVIHSELLLQSSVHEQSYVVGCRSTSSLADSPPSDQEVGFFSCVTSMFCSAVQNIPAFSHWRKDYKNRPKRSRSPEPRAIEDVPHKKPCFDCDIRENPIKCRKPISSSS